MAFLEQILWIIAQLLPKCQQLAKRNLDRQGFEPYLPAFNFTIRLGALFVGYFTVTTWCECQ